MGGLSDSAGFKFWVCCAFERRRGQGDRGINADGVSAFMPRKPLDAFAVTNAIGKGQGAVPLPPPPRKRETPGRAVGDGLFDKRTQPHGEMPLKDGTHVYHGGM